MATDLSPLLNRPIKATARYTSEYHIGRLNGDSTTPYASAHLITPHTPLGLGLRDTSIVACRAAVRAFNQTRRKSKSFAL